VTFEEMEQESLAGKLRPKVRIGVDVQSL